MPDGLADPELVDEELVADFVVGVGVEVRD